jgi:hypothetical protein
VSEAEPLAGAAAPVPSSAWWKRRADILGLLAVAGAGSLPILLPDVSRDIRSMGEIQDFAHLPLFAAITVVLLRLDRRASRDPAVSAGVRPYARVFFLALLLGILIEVLQPWFGHSLEAADILRDAAGSAAALLVSMATSLPRHDAARRRLGAGAALVSVPFLLPVLAALGDEAAARQQFPILADFEGPGQPSRFGTFGCRLEVEPDGQGGRHLRAHFEAGEYPRLGLRYFPRDWSGQGSFAFTCTNPGSSSLRLFLRIDDLEHDRTFYDRFNIFIEVRPGRNEITIPLDDVRRAPRRRDMDLTRVRSAYFYLFRLGEDRELLFDDFRLLPAGDDPSLLPASGQGNLAGGTLHLMPGS